MARSIESFFSLIVFSMRKAGYNTNLRVLQTLLLHKESTKKKLLNLREGPVETLNLSERFYLELWRRLRKNLERFIEDCLCSIERILQRSQSHLKRSLLRSVGATFAIECMSLMKSLMRTFMRWILRKKLLKPK